MYTTEKSLVAASLNASLVTTDPVGQVMFFGKLKANGDNQMYPAAYLDLSGWNVRDMACGNQTFFVVADSSCISWGAAQYQELGYGEKGKKSSANAAKVGSCRGAADVPVP